MNLLLGSYIHFVRKNCNTNVKKNEFPSIFIGTLVDCKKSTPHTTIKECKNTFQCLMKKKFVDKYIFFIFLISILFPLLRPCSDATRCWNAYSPDSRLAIAYRQTWGLWIWGICFQVSCLIRLLCTTPRGYIFL